MSEQIVIILKPTEYKHLLYIFSNRGEDIPITWESTIENLGDTLNKAIADYNINTVRLNGPHDYTVKIMEDLYKSVSTQFGLTKTIDIALI